MRGLATDFERALALEAYFRDSGAFRYSIEVDPGHAATDLADWLLDPASPNYHTGYCEQFATAMAVMARLVGLPSRVVLGFTPGWLLDDGRVVVSDRNAHAWVELWMPTQGWVALRPHAPGRRRQPGHFRRPALRRGRVPGHRGHLARPSPRAPNPPVSRPEDDERDRPFPRPCPASERRWELPAVPAWLIAARRPPWRLAFGLIPAVKWARRRHRLRALSTGDVSAAWREIVDRLSDLGEEPSPAATPVEVAGATDPAMLPLARAYGESIYGPAGRPGIRPGPGGGRHPVAGGHRGAPVRPLLAGSAASPPGTGSAHWLRAAGARAAPAEAADKTARGSTAKQPDARQGSDRGPA